MTDFPDLLKQIEEREKSPERQLEKAAARWWIEKIAREQGWDISKKHPMSWLDEMVGSASYPPATGWLLWAMDHPVGMRTERWEPFMEQLVIRGEHEYEWVEQVQKRVVELYSQQKGL